MSRTYQIGDRIELTVEVIYGGQGIFATKIVGYEGNTIPHFNLEELNAGRLLPRALKVGDTVRELAPNSVPGDYWKIVAIDGDFAWARRALSAAGWIFPLSDLRLIPDPPSETEAKP